MLCEHEVPMLVDVRLWPGGRLKTEFTKNRLAAALEASGIVYVHLKASGNKKFRRSCALLTRPTKAATRAGWPTAYE